MERIKQLGKLAISLEWGSPEQIDAENEFYILVQKILNCEDFEKLENYALKATTSESIDYAFKLINQ
jgi:hypothetical protein|tara:strand:+ start:310 stop:510 length:201 start_codon:yes stop_codon:yes gene_type:complete